MYSKTRKTEDTRRKSESKAEVWESLLQISFVPNSQIKHIVTWAWS